MGEPAELIVAAGAEEGFVELVVELKETP